jgi:hypothetical protein
VAATSASFAVDVALSSDVLVTFVAVLRGRVARSDFTLAIVAVASSAALNNSSLVEVVLFWFRGFRCRRWWRRLFLLYQRAALISSFYRFPSLDKLILWFLPSNDDLLRFATLFPNDDGCSGCRLANDDRLRLRKVFCTLAVLFHVIRSLAFAGWRKVSFSLEAVFSNPLTLWRGRWWGWCADDFRLALDGTIFRPIIVVAFDHPIVDVTAWRRFSRDLTFDDSLGEAPIRFVVGGLLLAMVMVVMITSRGLG